MKKLATIVLSLGLLASTASAAPILEYNVTDIGGGLYAYEFILNGNDGLELSFGTTDLTFTGQIHQMAAFGGFVPVHDESNANGYHVNPPAAYNKNLDTWMYDGWAAIAGGVTDVGGWNGVGSPVILSVGSGTDTYYQQKSLIHLVASSDVTWSGIIARDGDPYHTSGLATPDIGPVDGDSQDNPVNPNPEQGPRGEWVFDDVTVPVADGGTWFDPPIADAYIYETTDGSKFIGVMLPGNTGPNAVPDSDGLFMVDDGFNPPVEVAAGTLHPLGDGGAGVESFIVSGIDPTVNGDDPLAFPTFLQFDQTEVSFTQTGIPEPATMGLILFGAMGLLARRRRNRN
jgi:hypothetical protein